MLIKLIIIALLLIIIVNLVRAGLVMLKLRLPAIMVLRYTMLSLKTMMLLVIA